MSGEGMKCVACGRPILPGQNFVLLGIDTGGGLRSAHQSGTTAMCPEPKVSVASVAKTAASDGTLRRRFEALAEFYETVSMGGKATTRCSTVARFIRGELEKGEGEDRPGPTTRRAIPAAAVALGAVGGAAGLVPLVWLLDRRDRRRAALLARPHVIRIPRPRAPRSEAP